MELDSDKDGKVTKEELSEGAERIFEKGDLDNDGAIDKEEARSGKRQDGAKEALESVFRRLKQFTDQLPGFRFVSDKKTLYGSVNGVVIDGDFQCHFTKQVSFVLRASVSLNLTSLSGKAHGIHNCHPGHANTL